MVGLFSFKDDDVEESDVLDRVQRALQATGYHKVGRVRCTIETVDGNKHLILKGSVSSFFLKQMAQAAVIGKVDGYEIRNLIEVEFSEF